MTNETGKPTVKHTHHVSFGRTYRADCPACQAKTAAYLAPSAPRIVAECWTCRPCGNHSGPPTMLRERCDCFDSLPFGCEGFVHRDDCNGIGTHPAGHDVRVKA